MSAVLLHEDVDLGVPLREPQSQLADCPRAVSQLKRADTCVNADVHELAPHGCTPSKKRRGKRSAEPLPALWRGAAGARTEGGGGAPPPKGL